MLASHDLLCAVGAAPRPTHQCSRCKQESVIEIRTVGDNERLCERHWQQRCDLIGPYAAKRVERATAQRELTANGEALLRAEGVIK